MRAGFKGMAERGEQARERFIEYAREHAGLSRSEAERVIIVYKKARVLKFDHVDGRFIVKHGAFLDRDTLRRAAKS